MHNATGQSAINCILSNCDEKEKNRKAKYIFLSVHARVPFVCCISIYFLFALYSSACVKIYICYDLKRTL